MARWINEPVDWGDDRLTQIGHKSQRSLSAEAQMVSENQPVTHRRAERLSDYPVGANVCCFCGKPVQNDESERCVLKIQTTDGNVLVVLYDERCLASGWETMARSCPFDRPPTP